MNVSNIISQVRWAIDEESGSTDFVDERMDNIIKASIGHALRWVLMYVDASMLLRGNGADGGFIEESKPGKITHEVDLGTDCMRVLRVKGANWRKAILTPIREDSDEYAMQKDDTEKADVTHPVVILEEGIKTIAWCYPDDKITIHYVKVPTLKSSYGTTDSVAIPELAETAFIYYIAYLVMVAYNETTKASNMLATAKMNAGASLNTQQSS